VDFAGIQKRVNLSYVPEAVVGDYVLVHVGFAISTIDQAEAEQVFAYLKAMGDLADIEEPPS
jgi:hydrogenase expression/formation protein HypC